MKQRDDLEFLRKAIFGDVRPDQNAGARQERHFRMADFIRLAAGEREPDRLKRPAAEHFPKGLDHHTRQLYHTRGIAVE